MKREISSLRWVRRLDEKPHCIPAGRPRGAKRLGVKFEDHAALALPGAERGVWFEFEDSAGHGFAQADFVWQGRGYAVVGEAKLTWRASAYVQLRRLYFPLVQLLLGCPVGGIVVCKNLTRETPRAEVTSDLPLALAATRGGIIPVLHLPL